MFNRFRTVQKLNLVLILGLLLLTGFLASSIASYYVSRNNIHQSILNRELPLTSDNIHSQIQSILLPPLNVAATMANSVFLRDWILEGETDTDKICDYLKKMQVSQSMISSFLISDISQHYYSFSGKISTLSPATVGDEWYYRCKNGEPDFEINADIDNHGSNQYNLFINHKVFDYNNHFIGITGVATNIDSIKEIIEHYKATYGIQIYFVSPTGAIAYQTNNGLIDIKKTPLEIRVGSGEVADRILSQHESTLSYKRRGKHILLNARFLPELQWYLIVEEPDSRKVGELRGLFLVNLGVSLLITAVVLVIVYLTIEHYQKRLIKNNKQLCNNNDLIQQQAESLQQQSEVLAQRNLRLKQLHREKDSFMNMIVHDLKTPLSNMIGLSGLIKDCEIDLDAKEYASLIQSQGGDMIILVQNILDLQELASIQTPKLETIDLQQLIDSKLLKWTLLGAQKSIHLSVAPTPVTAPVSANHKWVADAMENLVSNAVKFSQPNQDIEISVCLINENYRINITDHGPGNAEDEKPLLFKQFSRLSNQPTANESSNGLGLFIVKSLVEKMNGTVGLDSKLGEGCTFWIELPAVLKA